MARMRDQINFLKNEVLMMRDDLSDEFAEMQSNISDVSYTIVGLDKESDTITIVVDFTLKEHSDESEVILTYMNIDQPETVVAEMKDNNRFSATLTLPVSGSYHIEYSTAGDSSRKEVLLSVSPRSVLYDRLSDSLNANLGSDYNDPDHSVFRADISVYNDHKTNDDLRLVSCKIQFFYHATDETAFAELDVPKSERFSSNTEQVFSSYEINEESPTFSWDPDKAETDQEYLVVYYRILAVDEFGYEYELNGDNRFYINN
jgi:hypothetical protein